MSITDNFAQVTSGMNQAEKKAFESSINAALSKTIVDTAERAKGNVRDSINAQHLIPYAKAMKKAQGNGKALEQVKSSYKAKGLNVQSIDVFSVIQDLDAGNITESE